MDKCSWQSDKQIIIREVSKNKVWTVRPVTIIQDSPELIVFYIAPGTTFKHPRKLNIDEVPQHLVANDWRMVDKTWNGGGALYISKPGEPYMIIGFRNDDNTEFQRWYVNLQDPLIRTRLGFDYLDMELDIEIDKSLSEWHWKDEDKFKDLVAKGIISEPKAGNLRKVGKDIANNIVNEPSIITSWIGWTPSSDFSIPPIPNDWDNI